VTITGKDLGELARVTFNGTDGIIKSNSETKVVVDVPGGATTGQLSVVSECCDVSFSKNFHVKWILKSRVPETVTRSTQLSG
jgi:hypothetical protein